MRPRANARRRVRFVVDELEPRRVLDGTSYTVPLAPELDQFGDQIATVQAYGDGSRATFGIFDTGASAITFSPADQDLFTFFGDPIPIKIAGGAVAGGIGGTITGDISEPGTIIADGIHAMSFDLESLKLFEYDLGAESASMPGVQALVGTTGGSPDLPTITGTPILNPTPDHPQGLAARIDMHGYAFDLSGLLPELEGFVMTMPDLHFVPSGTALTAAAGTAGPFYVPLGFFGLDNHTDPGDQLTETPSPIQNDVGILDGTGNVVGKDFLLDTGAQLTVVSTAIAEALGLDLDSPETSITVQGVAGSQDVPGFTVDQLTMPTTDGGTLTFTNVPIYVLDVAPGIDGLLGMNLFNTADALLYDPNLPGGARLGVTFSTDLNRGLDPSDSMLGFMRLLGLGSFAGVVTGHQLPGITFASDTTPTPDPVATQVVVTSSAGPSSVIGTSVSFIATVTALTGTGVPTSGSVTFTVDGVPQAPVAIAADGTATLPARTLAIGTHTVSAAYGGSDEFAPSTAAPITHTVTRPATQTTLAASRRGSYLNQPVTFTATVKAVSPAPTGTVTFRADGQVLGTVPLRAVGTTRRAALSVPTLGFGPHTVTAEYNGNARLAASTSDGLEHPVARTALVLTAVPTTAVPGQRFDVVVEYRDPFGQLVTGFRGTVTLARQTGPAGGVLRGAVSVRAVQGVARFSVTLSKAGTYTLRSGTASQLPALTPEIVVAAS